MSGCKKTPLTVLVSGVDLETVGPGAGRTARRDGPIRLFHADGALGADVHASLAVGAVVLIDDGLAVDEADALGGADLDAVLATGALGRIHDRGHWLLLLD
jgi:hypothetical protein